MISRYGLANTPGPLDPPVLRAELEGDNRCSAAGVAVASPAPVLELCRRLVAAGHDPFTPLAVYRGAELALRVSSIGAGAGLDVSVVGNGSLSFVPYRPRHVVTDAKKICLDVR